jgi:UV DNA damage endonuclease
MASPRVIRLSRFITGKTAASPYILSGDAPLGHIRIGYACVNTRLPSTSRTCRLERAAPEVLLELARQNLLALRQVLAWNARHGIRLFRISSGIIPFGSHPVNQTPWWDLLQPELDDCAGLIRYGEMRVSMHPGQYTVLNSPREEVVENSLAELEYHARFLDALGLDAQHKLILHLGGVYGDKDASRQRFGENFQRLSPRAARRLVLENDEKSYTLADVLPVSRQTGAPVVLDVFHHAWNPSYPELSLLELVNLAGSTWQPADGPPKLHYSNQWAGKPPGSHSQTVDVESFVEFYQQLGERTLDVMLEVKDKEQSVLAVMERLGVSRA